jgi:pSer/pThr/pTyr-binding forkhead associated (FHA) protein
MVKKFFRNRNKGADTPAPTPAPTPTTPKVDEDETIVINLSGGGETETPRVVLEEPAKPTFQPDAAPTGDQDETEVYIPGGAETEPEVRGTVSAGTSDGPVAGWLVTSSAENRGQSFAITLGRNSIGRGAENSICVDLGDTTIARSNHVAIAADPVSRKFYLVPGESRNLAYFNGSPLLEAQEISDRDKIQLGSTEFMLVQFLGNYIDWD